MIFVGEFVNFSYVRVKGLVIAVVVILALIGAAIFLASQPKTTIDNSSESVTSKNDVQTVSWKEGGVAIGGAYADAEVVDLGGGKLRMYYSAEPEVSGNKLELFSAVSTDGINWTKESGVRKTFATFPDVIKLPDGRFRLYYQNMGVIKSALSADGLNWADESGTRIDQKESGFVLETVGAQSTTLLPNGTYIMVYRGVENKPYGTEKLPNQTTSNYFYATSADGITFIKKGLAIDSRNNVLKGFVDGAEWVNWNENNLRVYFWSYSGIYHVDFNSSLFSSKPVFDFTNHPGQLMSPDPPGDPTLAKINGKWMMYYGLHTKGIYSAILSE